MIMRGIERAALQASRALAAFGLLLLLAFAATQLADGLMRGGHDEAAQAIADDSLALIRAGGFAEYYDPLDGAALGGSQFTWTAAMVVELLAGSVA